MNPLSLHARNYRSFETLDVDLPDGCVAVLGENGYGKSSVVEAIEVALFGECRTGRLPAQLTLGVTDEEMLIELELTHAHEHYRIRRTYKAKKSPTLDLERYDVGDAWMPLTCSSTKETQQLIEQTIGLSRETFRASAFLAQGDGAAFTEAQPRDRKRILAEVLGLEQWAVLVECARAERRLLETRQAALAGKTAQAEEQAAALPQLDRDHADILEAETVAADNVADLERSHQELAVQYQDAREHAARRAAAEAELKTAEGVLATLTARDQEASKASIDRSTLTAALEKLPAYPPLEELRARETVLAAACDAHERAQLAYITGQQAAVNAESQRQTLVVRSHEARERADKIRAAMAELDAVPHDEATCDRCKQVLAGNARAIAVESMANEASEHLAEQARLLDEAAAVVIPAVPPKPEGEPPTVELDLARKTIDAANSAALDRATLTERIRQCEQIAGSGPSPDEMLDARTAAEAKRAVLEGVGTPPDVNAITAQGNLVADQLRGARAAVDGYRTQRARLDERILVAKAAAEQLQANSQERQTLGTEVDIVVALERAFSPDGIPALIVENSAIPYLETEANRILVELGTAFRVELRTQAALKSGDGLRDTLDVIVCSEKGERPYETFSGGERTRINLALRIALARLLAHRRGAESRLLVVDEPDGLDDAGMAALVDVLRSLEGDFDKLYIVSHVPGLRDSFDTTLSVVNDEHGSHVVEAGVFEAVAA